MSDLNKTLADRQKTHGDFQQVAKVAESLMNSIEFQRLSASQSFAVRMIIGKLARIVCGNPNEPDHWHDIAGYAKLVEDELVVAAVNDRGTPDESSWIMERDWGLGRAVFGLAGGASEDIASIHTMYFGWDRICFTAECDHAEYLVNRLINRAKQAKLKVGGVKVDRCKPEPNQYSLRGLFNPVLITMFFEGVSA